MAYVDLPDARYWYETGAGQSPAVPQAGDRPFGRTPLVLLHGFTGSSAGWAELTTRVLRPWIALDLPGHGATEVTQDPDRFGMERVAADVAACIRLLAGRPVHLLGYSMGGRLALYLALHHPEIVTSLVLESSSPGLEVADARAERRMADNALADRIELVGVERFVDEWEALPLFAGRRALPAAVRQRLRARQLENSAGGLAASLRGMGTGVQPQLWGRLAELAMPVLLITGALDTKFCTINRMMQQCIPSARHVILANAGHTGHLERPGAYSTELARFLDHLERQDCRA